MSDFIASVFWLTLAVLFARWGISSARRRDDWTAAMNLVLAGSYVVLASTTSLR